MKKTNKPTLNWFVDKVGLYKESRRFVLVKVVNTEETEDDMIFFHLKIIEKFHATFDENNEFRFYDSLPKDWKEEFRFGGKKVSYHQEFVYVMYIGELIFEEGLIKQFRNKDIHFIDNF